MRFITNHQVAAILAVLLAACTFFMMTGFGVPQKIAVGATILCILAVSIFWTLLDLGPYSQGDDDDDE